MGYCAFSQTHRLVVPYGNKQQLTRNGFLVWLRQESYLLSNLFLLSQIGFLSLFQNLYQQLYIIRGCKIIEEKADLIKLLREAIENNSMAMYYQLQIFSENNSETIIGVEALVRWIDKEKGVISPDNTI